MDIINFDTVETNPLAEKRVDIVETYEISLEQQLTKDTNEDSVYYKLKQETAELDEAYDIVGKKLNAAIDRRIANIVTNIKNLMVNLTDQEIIIRIVYNDLDVLEYKTVFIPVNEGDGDDFTTTLLQVTKKFNISKIDVFGNVLNAKQWVTELSDLINERRAYA